MAHQPAYPNSVPMGAFRGGQPPPGIIIFPKSKISNFGAFFVLIYKLRVFLQIFFINQVIIVLKFFFFVDEF